MTESVLLSQIEQLQKELLKNMEDLNRLTKTDNPSENSTAMLEAQKKISEMDTELTNNMDTFAQMAQNTTSTISISQLVQTDQELKSTKKALDEKVAKIIDNTKQSQEAFTTKTKYSGVVFFIAALFVVLVF